MIFVVYGTTAEYIKLMPLILALRERNACFTIALSQHERQLTEFFDAHTDLPAPDLWLVRGFAGRDLASFAQVPIWFGKVALAIARSWRTVRRVAGQAGSPHLWIVHGDTFTTVVGAMWGRLLGYPVAHVEAGLRSRSILHPFPEELDRLIVTRLARVHFAPGAAAARNLGRATGDVVDTEVNTGHDALRYARDRARPLLPELSGRFGIVSLHRTEFVGNGRVFVRTLRTVAEYGHKVPLVFIEHPVTMTAARAQGLERLLRERLRCVPKLDYFGFVGLLARSSFVVTDSGGLQEDCAQLGKPCLLIRRATERPDGIAEGVVRLSHYDDADLRDFLDDAGAHSGARLARTARPVRTIMSYLEDEGYVRRCRPTNADAGAAPASEAQNG